MGLGGAFTHAAPSGPCRDAHEARAERMAGPGGTAEMGAASGKGGAETGQV